MSSQWGRIDEDGTVFVRTPSGERVIGSWQAGDAEAGLAYYIRRYDDLATEVTLLEQRLMSGAGDPATTRGHAIDAGRDAAYGRGDRRPRQPGRPVVRAARRGAGEGRLRKWPNASRPGRARSRPRSPSSPRPSNIAAVVHFLEGLRRSAAGHRRGVEADQGHRPSHRRRAVEAIRRRARCLRQAPGSALRPPGHRARARPSAVKEKLVARAEELSTSSDWKETAAAHERPDGRVEGSGPGEPGRRGRALEEVPRRRRTAFFARRSGVFAERDAEQVHNLQHKEAIIAEAERDRRLRSQAAQAQMRELQDRYDDIGHVPREAMRTIGRPDARRRAAGPGRRRGAVAPRHGRVQPVPGRVEGPAGRGRGQAGTGRRPLVTPPGSPRPRPRSRQRRSLIPN